MLIRGSQIISGTVADLQIQAAAGIQTTKLADGANLAFLDGTRPFTGVTNFGGFRVTNTGLPIAPGDAVNLAYLNTLNLGMTLKMPVRVATLTSIGASYAANVLTLTTGMTVLDGLTLLGNDRILVRAESVPANNGIYTYTSPTTLTRSTDFNSGGVSGTIQMGDFIIVNDGNTYRGQAFILTEPFNFTPPLAVGTTALNFTAYGNPGQLTPGNGIQITGTTITAVAAATSGVQVLSGGISLLLADNSLQTISSGVSVRPYAGLSTSVNGLSVVNGNGLSLAASAGGALSVNPTTNGGIQVTAGGVGLLLPVSSGLQTTATGLSIQLSGSTLAIGAGGISLAALTSAFLLVGNSSNVATGVALSGDATLSNSGVLTLTSAAAGGGVKATNFSNGETVGGTVNGANTAFTIAFTSIANTECVYVNGIRQKRTADYSLSGAAVTFVTAPFTGDAVTIDYIH